MEVHHTHHPAHKKKWTEYLLEFLMLFLAVFLGFTAENIREHKIEKHREHQYLESLVNDLRADTANAEFVKRDFEKRKIQMDSLIMNFPDLIKGKPGVYLRNWRGFAGFEDFHFTDGTLQQLKNSGGLRLVRNARIRDSIMSYDLSIKDMMQQAEWMITVYRNTWELRRKCIDHMKVDSIQTEALSSSNILTTSDPMILNEFYSILKSLRSNQVDWVGKLIAIKTQATRLMNLLEDE